MAGHNQLRSHIGKLLGKGAFEDARTLLNDLISTEGSDEVEQRDWYLYLGLSNYFLRDFEAAIRCCQKVIFIDNKCIAAHGTLAYIYASCPNAAIHRADKAVYHASRACDLTAWRDWKVLTVLAAAYARQGRYEPAATVALTALQLAPNGNAKERAGQLLNLMREHMTYTADPDEDFERMVTELTRFPHTSS